MGYFLKKDRPSRLAFLQWVLRPGLWWVPFGPIPCLRGTQWMPWISETCSPIVPGAQPGAQWNQKRWWPPGTQIQWGVLPCQDDSNSYYLSVPCWFLVILHLTNIYWTLAVCWPLSRQWNKTDTIPSVMETVFSHPWFTLPFIIPTAMQSPWYHSEVTDKEIMVQEL